MRQTSPLRCSKTWRWRCLTSGAFPVLQRAFVYRHGDGYRLFCHVRRFRRHGRRYAGFGRLQQHAGLATHFLGVADGHRRHRLADRRGLSALQTVTIASALPFSAILLISIYGLLKALRRDLTKRDSQNMATIAPTAARNPIPGSAGCAISPICQNARWLSALWMRLSNRP